MGRLARRERTWIRWLIVGWAAVSLVACADAGAPRTPAPETHPPTPSLEEEHDNVPPRSTATPTAVTINLFPTSTPDCQLTTVNCQLSTAINPLPPTLTPTSLPTATALPVPNKYGVHLLLDDGRNVWPQAVWAEHIAYARAAVGAGGYVTELVRGDNLDPAYWQVFMDLCREAELIPVLRLATTFDLQNNWWNAPTPDADGSYRAVAYDYAGFINALDWHSERHFVIVGNEPNHGNEWSNAPDPAQYARFLYDVGSAIHAADPLAAVLNAGLDMYSPHTGGSPAPDGFVYIDADAFMDGMFRSHPEAFGQIDVWSSHSYPMGPFAAPPWEQTFKIDVFHPALLDGRAPPPQGLPNRGVNGYEWELAKLAQLGIAPIPVMITETGWRHAESSDPAALDTGAGLPSAAQVAVYLDLALNGNNGRYPDLPNAGWRSWTSDPRVLGVTVFAFDGAPREWGHTSWLIVAEDGTVTGTYPMAVGR